MKFNRLLAVVIILSSVIDYSFALDECRDTDNTSCQSCGDNAYPRDEFYRKTCMRTCGVCTGTNIALGKPTRQSSRYYDGVHDSKSSNAVDGNTDNKWENGHCSHTDDNGNEWWCVDLQQIYNIDNIKLFNRDKLKERLRGFEIKISSSGQCNQTGFTSATSCYKDTTTTVQDIYTIDRCNQPTSTSISARTVYVTVSSRPLALCEVQIFSAKPTNVAFGQQLVQQSSTNYGAVASRAVDGNTNSDFDNGKSCTHTREELGSGWWCVDLQQLYYFNQIKIYNINNTMWWGRLQGFEIKTSSSGQCSGQGLQSATSCYKDTTSTIQSVYTVTGCNQGSTTSFSGRTIYVKSFNDSLTLCEVEIFADLAQCNTGYYSISSSTCQPCNTCYNNTCDPTTGVCTGDCKTGFYGTKCQPCNTCHDDRCDSTSGVCTGDCKTGFYGTRCQQNCSNGCLNNQCFNSDGKCNDCKPDTVGPYCNLTCGAECQPRSDQNTTTCDRYGTCTNCITGRYGDGCNISCNTGCNGGCDRKDGNCTSCIKGKTGDRCDINCNNSCTVCNQNNINSCTECKDGRWGSSCNKLCNTNCKPVVGKTVGKCDQMTGDCINGCVPGKIGFNCTTALSPVVYVVIGLLCGILGSVAVFLSYHFYKKRRQSNNPKDDTVPDYVYSNTDLNLTSSTTDDTLTTGFQNIPTNTRNVEYENQSFNTEDNTRTLYDTLDHTPDSTQHTYTILDCNKIK